MPVPCSGVDHLDFSADGSYLIASCEFSSEMVKVALGADGPSLVGTLRLYAGSKPQDVKLSPDGSVFYVADMVGDGVWEIDGDTLRDRRVLAHGRGRARPVRQPRLEGSLRVEPRRGHRLGRRSCRRGRCG